MTDAALVLRARGGDQVAYATLVHRFKGFAVALADDYFFQGADRDDVVSEGLHGLVKAVRDWKPDGGASFGSFALSCMRRQVQTAIKTADRQKHRILTVADRLDAPVVESVDEEDRTLGERLPDRTLPDPVEVMERRDSLAEVLSFARRLSPLEHAAISGVAAGHTYEEISDITGLREKSIDNALQRARVKYRREVAAA